MRSILRYPQFRSFSTSKLSQVISHTAEQTKQQQSVNYHKYEDFFFKLYTTHLQRQRTVQLNVKKLDSLCMMSDFPCKAIVQYFHSTGKSYSQEYTVQTFIRLARAYKISQADNASTADFNINRLFFTPAFENLIEEYKFGLRKENAMRWDNAFLVAECLIEIGYADYEVFSILLNMVETRLNKQQRTQTEIRPFQIQKLDYYTPLNRSSQQNLSGDPQFQKVLKLLSQKVNQFQSISKKQTSINDLKAELNSNEESQNIYNSILQSVKLIESYNNDLVKLIEGILTIRKQYRKMVELSESKAILRHPEINLELLELEEMLLVKQLISIADIKSPERLDNNELELKRVEQILVTLIQPEGSGELLQFINTNFNESENKQAQRMSKMRDIAEFGRAMATLSRFAQLSRRLYNSPDARSLVTMKWEKTLLLWDKLGAESKESRENLHVEKLFRRTFADLFKMMKRSYSIFMFTFIQAPLRYKIEFFESLTRLGFHEQLIYLLQSEDLSKERIETYSNAEFFSLIKILNEVGQKVNSENLKRGALKHLKQLLEQSQVQESKSIFSLEFSINAANFIVQNFPTVSADMKNVSSKDETQVVYEGIINKLAQQVKYYEQCENFLTHDQLYEGLRILALERPGEFKLDDNFYIRYEVNPSDKKDVKNFLYKRNPFTSIVKELCDKYATSPTNRAHPFIETGFNAKGQFTAVLVCSSNQTSISGKSVVGNINAYIQRVKREYGITITPLAVNSLLEIDYDKSSENKQFQFKQKAELSQIISSLFKRDQLHLMSLSSILSNITLILEKHFKRSHLYGLVKFLNTLNGSISLFEKEKNVFSWNLFRFRRYRLFVQLDALKEDYNLMDKSVREELDKMWKKDCQGLEFFKKYPTVFNAVESIQTIILNSIGTKNPEPLSRQFFEGKRFTIDTFIEGEDLSKQNIGVQFINPTVYIDKTFCPYSDWSKQLNLVYPLEAVKLSSSSNIIKILGKRFLPKANEELHLLPFTKKSDLKSRPQFSMTSLDPVNQQTQKSLQKEHQIEPAQLEQVRQLLSFIHQLKLTKSEQQLVEYIFSLDFIANLQTPNQKSNSSVTLLPREPYSYFNHLQSANNKLHLESPNLNYLFSKLELNEEISEVLNERKLKRNEVKIEFQLGQISQKQYFDKCSKIDDYVIQKLEQLKKNVLDNVDQYKFFENGLKMIKLEKDQKELERVMNRPRYYYRNLDKDFVHSKGNLQRCLKIKRSKAEKTLALYRILYKLAKGDTALTEADRQLLKKEATLITYRLENKKQHSDSFSEKFTSLSIGDLSKSDKQRLNLPGSNLSKFSSLPLTDLVVQLVNLLDPKIYENFERSIYKKYYSSVHQIPEELFLSSLNKEFTKLAHEEERAIVNEKSKLGFYEMGLLNEMVQTFKTESKTGKERFNNIYSGFYEEIEQLNNSQARVELISEYLNQKELEFNDDFNPKLITEIKQRQTMKLWNVIFKKSYQQTDSELIRTTVEKLCERIRLMGENVPPFFGLLVIKILEHPATDVLSKQNLLSNLEYFKTPIQVDSQDVRTLGLGCGQEQNETLLSSQRLIEKIGLVSNKNFLENLNKKINMIV